MMNTYRFALPAAICLFVFVVPSSSYAQDSGINPRFFYMVNGQPVNRTISLGDPTNWSLNLQGRQGASAGGKIEIVPAEFKAKDDAIRISWNPKKDIQGNLGLYGAPIDISSFKNTASLSIDMRVEKKPNKDVNVGLDCGYPCRADLKINGLIKAMPMNEWFTLPLPLNCFKGDNFDLSKINGAFTISTSGRLTMSIANVRLEKLAEGEKGCVEVQ